MIFYPKTLRKKKEKKHPKRKRKEKVEGEMPTNN